MHAKEEVKVGKFLLSPRIRRFGLDLVWWAPFHLSALTTLFLLPERAEGSAIYSVRETS
jgi:hypothetical protein